MHKGKMVTNANVVPYCRAALWRFNCHVCAEVCSTIHSVKYLHKYIHKGGDRAEVELAGTDALDASAPVEAQVGHKEDEIRQYLDGRYISTSEAVWRALKFPLHHTLRRPFFTAPSALHFFPQFFFEVPLSKGILSLDVIAMSLHDKAIRICGFEVIGLHFL